MRPNRNFSPLRYPGGKAKVAAFVKQVIERNDLLDGDYVEPYAGGAAIAIDLLLNQYVSRIHINDISRPVYAFWYAILNHTDSFLRKIKETPLTLSSWDSQKRVLTHQEDYDYPTLGFATFFLNRTNRSGILNAGVIGGRAQVGTWKIDARYNANDLCDRVEEIARHRCRIAISREDAEKFLLSRCNDLPPKTLIYLDPPYYSKGKDLYYDYYEHRDHEEIASVVLNRIVKQKWIVSYDNVRAIRNLYREVPGIAYALGYSARETRTGSELMFFSKNLVVPGLAGAMRPLRGGVRPSMRVAESAF
jgi:DNA adenine methylase